MNPQRSQVKRALAMKITLPKEDGRLFCQDLLSPFSTWRFIFFPRDQAKSECDWVVMDRNIRPKFAVFCFITFLFCAPCFASAH